MKTPQVQEMIDFAEFLPYETRFQLFEVGLFVEDQTFDMLKALESHPMAKLEGTHYWVPLSAYCQIDNATSQEYPELWNRLKKTSFVRLRSEGISDD